MAFHEMSVVNEQYEFEGSSVFLTPTERVEREMEFYEVMAGFSAALMLLSGCRPREVFDLFGGREETERVLGTEAVRELDNLDNATEEQ